MTARLEHRCRGGGSVVLETDGELLHVRVGGAWNAHYIVDQKDAESIAALFAEAVKKFKNADASAR